MRPFWSYIPDLEAHEEEMLSALRETLRSGRVILGPRVEEFERVFSAWCSTEAYGVGVASGTDAIALALRALGIQSGDEVLTVANTAVPTIAAIRMAGAVPRFVDIEPDTGLMDPEALAAAGSVRAFAVLPVHLWGQACDMNRISEIARRRGAVLVEDCAQAHGALTPLGRVGAIGQIGCFSFYPTKILGGYGDGGMCVTRSADTREELRELRMYGMRGDYYAWSEGVNSRLDEIQATILLAKFARLGAAIEERKRLAALYDRLLADSAVRSTRRIGRDHVYYAYTIRVANRDEIVSVLHRSGYESKIYFPIPVPFMKAYGFLGVRRGELPETERAAREILSLPLYPGLPDRDVEALAAAVREAAR